MSSCKLAGKLRHAVLVALFLLATQAGIVSAQDLNYDYIQGGLAIYPDWGNQDFVGIDMQGSYQFIPDFPDIFLFGGIKYLTDEVDLAAIHLGSAYKLEIHDATDIYGGPSVEYQYIDFDNGDDSDVSLGLRSGIRHRIINSDWELGCQLRFVTGDWDYFGIRGTAQYFIDENLGLLLEADSYDGEFGLLGGVRYNF